MANRSYNLHMKHTLTALLIASQITLAHADWDDPSAPFDATVNKTSTITLTWRVVDNVQKTCEQEYARRGHNVFGYAVDACSFWEGNNCTIITKKKPTMHSVGHEVRHCFQGNWH